MSKQSETRTAPISHEPSTDRPVHLAVTATWKDPTTGALYVHEDLVRHQEPWAEEAHIRPMKGDERFGDVESFVAFVIRHGEPDRSHLTWNSSGLRAVLDFADVVTDEPGRCQWTASLPFCPSTQWRQWMAFASGQSMSQKTAVEKLEDLAGDIVSPSQADLMALLRSLRASVNSTADTELRPDGTTRVAFNSDAKVQTAKSVELPQSFAIAIPVLRGHVDAEGRPVVYRLDVRMRVSVDDAAKLTLRFAVPTAERVLEDVYADRVATAKALLGDSFDLLRAADA